MSWDADTPLADLGVIVTRPRDQGEALCSGLERLGATTFHVPAIAIEPREPDGGWDQAETSLRDAAIVIFVSANAVRHCADHWPRDSETTVLAVGPATARALEAHGIPVSSTGGAGMDSESLLETDALRDVAGARVVIVRGEGGRRALDEALTERGAEHTALAVYRRVPAETDPAALLGPLRDGRARLVTVTSGAILDALWTLAGDEGRELLRDALLVVTSERVLQRSAELELRRTPLKASRPDDTGLIEAILEWARERRESPIP